MSESMTNEDRRTFLERCGASRADGPNMVRWLVSLLAWATCLTAANQLMKRGIVTESLLAWFLAILPTVAGLVAVWAFLRYLRETDELNRLIQYRAMAVGFGVGWLAIGGYPLFERLGAPPADGNDYFLVMTIAFAITSVTAWWRYR